MRKCSNDRLSTLTDDPYLASYLSCIRRRKAHADHTEQRLTGGKIALADLASGHEYFGLHRTKDEWVFREWAPNAENIHLVGTFSEWRESGDLALSRLEEPGTWGITLPSDALHHEDLYRLRVHWQGGQGDRIPAYARRVVQDDATKIFNAQVWSPFEPYQWRHGDFSPDSVPLIYETHIGIAQNKQGMGTYDEFRQNILPRIARAGYNAVQIMALMEHPYYASFGYQVSSFFAASSRFGTPEELKALIDEAHSMGLAVIMDLVHSHAVNNEVEGLSRFDGTEYQYFHEGGRGRHPAWDSRCFDYGKPEVLHFLLSNCRFWLDEYRLDGFRFDGITSMLYHHHGLGPAFDSYDRYFDDSVDEDAMAYLSLANKLVHSVRPNAVTIAEDVSGMPGLAAPIEQGGCGFDYRLAMSVPDCWFKLVNDVPDEDWNMSYIWHELTNRRTDEKTISYTESHDQALVGGKTLIFEMADANMYNAMRTEDQNLAVDRAMALHKMIRLATMATAAYGYMSFMGNEFGHPEWIDFPREGNDWSYHFARRQWHLRDDPSLKYHFLADFDQTMLAAVTKDESFCVNEAVLLHSNNEDKVFACGRGRLFFFFNFHPSRSVTDYAVKVPAGKYQLAISTDEARFGGQDLVQTKQHYHTAALKRDNSIEDYIRVYLPCRTALVLRKS
jgi:1,4-alpha-glucan branching enzyme